VENNSLKKSYIPRVPKLKILHILDHSLPLHSGYTFRSQSIFRAQVKRGWQPVVITSPKHEENWKGEWQLRETIGDFRYYRSGPVQKGMPFLGEWQMMKAIENRILQVADQEKPDILHAHSPVLNGLPALWAGRKLNIPVVYEIRAFWEDAAVDHGTYAEKSWKYKLTQSMETKVCRRADHVGVLCDGLKNDLIKRGISADKITPVFNGVNPDTFKPVPADKEFLEQWKLAGKKVIGFIGSFYRYEGLDLLVRAFSRIAAKRGDAILLLVGGGEMDPELRKLGADLGIGDRLVMPGRIPHERVPGVYAMIDILAYPRYPMRLTELVTPLKPLEAMAMGKTLVASDVGGHKELIRNNETGILFKAGDLEELTTSLNRILEDTKLRSQLEEQGREWVRDNKTWDKTTEVYKDIYRSVLKRRR
jgi:PEP-CTERM/exosortase A-associated glycosyltransferase